MLWYVHLRSKVLIISNKLIGSETSWEGETWKTVDIGLGNTCGWEEMTQKTEGLFRFSRLSVNFQNCKGLGGQLVQSSYFLNENWGSQFQKVKGVVYGFCSRRYWEAWRLEEKSFRTQVRSPWETIRIRL